MSVATTGMSRGLTVRGERVARVAAPIVVGILLLVAWQLLSGVQTGRLPLVPAPAAVFEQLVSRWDLILDNALITGGNALVGLIGGAILAIVLAGVAAWVRAVDGMLAPLVVGLAVIPIVALAPVLYAMFGLSAQTARQIVAGVAAFVPVFVNVLSGLRQTSAVQRDLFRASAATGAQTFRKLTLPVALPSLLTGLRLASALAVIAALVAEYFGGPANGLGTAIASYAKTGASALAFASVLAAISVGLVFFLVTVLLERLVTWRRPG
ncbi:ABC transporter permease [Microbacterium sp.]|uniref:ABC transporter permease n=1 Tax=Microbacterium sp. TaxID=51671 RepID=UPI003C76326B